LATLHTHSAPDISIPPAPHKSVVDAAWVTLLVYALLACAATWPLITRMESRLPIGTEAARTVPMFNAWTIWWNADRLAHGLRGYWDGPIFYPDRNTFALSEPQPMTMAVAPIVWMSGSPLLAYNVYLLISLAMNGWIAERLLRFVGLHRFIAVGGGCAMVLLPIVHWQIGVVQLVPLWGILWTWWAFTKIAAVPLATAAPRILAMRSGELALAFTASFYASVHHALFLAALLVLAGLVCLGRQLLWWRTWFVLCAAGVGVVILTSPILLHLREMTREVDFARPRETVEQLSLRVQDYAFVYGSSLLPKWPESDFRNWFASPGWFKLAWAALGVGWGMSIAAQRRWTALLIAIAGLAFGLSLGTHWEWGLWRPWHWLTDLFPGFAQVRSAFRFAYFVQIAVVLLAAQGVHGTWDWASKGGHRRSLKPVFAVVVIALGCAAIIDPWPSALKLAVVPDVEPHRDWIALLKGEREKHYSIDQTPHPDAATARASMVLGPAALCLPMAGGENVLDFEVTTQWMMLGTYHGMPLVNGYSGFFPPDYLRLREESWAGPLSDERLSRLFHDGVRYVVVDRNRYRREWHDALVAAPHTQVKLLLRSKSGIDVYELHGM